MISFTKRYDYSHCGIRLHSSKITANFYRKRHVKRYQTDISKIKRYVVVSIACCFLSAQLRVMSSRKICENLNNYNWWEFTQFFFISKSTTMAIVESRLHGLKIKRYCYRIHCGFFFKEQCLAQVVRMRCARIWIIIDWTRYLFSDWLKAYSEFSESAPMTS